MFTPIPASSGLVSHQLHLLRRFLTRLVNGWEYARDRDLDLLEAMFKDLDRAIRFAGEDGLPAGALDYAAAARRALTRARAAREDVRMRHLEIAGEAVDSLVACLPSHI